MGVGGDYILLNTGKDGKWDWARYAQNAEYLYGSNQGYENKDDAIDTARTRNPGIPVFEVREGRKVQIV